MTYHPPIANVDGLSTWETHWKWRTPPSTESGVDFFCPIGTPLYAAGNGVVVDIYDGYDQATGRFITIDLDDGRRVRYLHLSGLGVDRGQRVGYGEHIGWTGATGYGTTDFSNEIAPHVHVTLWNVQRYLFGLDGNGKPKTLDFWQYMDAGGSPAGGGAVPFDYGEDEEVGFQVQREDNRAVWFFEPGLIGWPAADNVVAVNNYVGIKGGFAINQVSYADWRRLVEVRGFDFGAVEKLRQGEAIDRSGKVFAAGINPW